MKERYAVIVNSGNLSSKRFDTISEAYEYAYQLYRNKTMAACSVWAIPTDKVLAKRMGGASRVRFEEVVAVVPDDY